MVTKMKLMVTLALLLTGIPASAQNGPPDQQQQQGGYSAGQLDEMLRSIALYPDPLLAQVLPATTQPGQVDAVAQYLRVYPNGQGVENQPWDASVKALAHYPDVVNLLDRDLQWTAAVGQAFATQPGDVTASIQRLRQEAYNYGNLQSSPQQTVGYDQNYVTIEPATPQYIYVPTYDPYLVYCPRRYWDRPCLSFGIGFSSGPWLTFGVDWIGGSCFNYPRGCYWGPGGQVCNNFYNRGYSYNQTNVYNVNYVHNTYNVNNQAAFRGNTQSGVVNAFNRSGYSPTSRGNGLSNSGLRQNSILPSVNGQANRAASASGSQRSTYTPAQRQGYQQTSNTAARQNTNARQSYQPSYNSASHQNYQPTYNAAPRQNYQPTYSAAPRPNYQPSYTRQSAQPTYSAPQHQSYSPQHQTYAPQTQQRQTYSQPSRSSAPVTHSSSGSAHSQSNSSHNNNNR